MRFKSLVDLAMGVNAHYLYDLGQWRFDLTRLAEIPVNVALEWVHTLPIYVDGIEPPWDYRNQFMNKGWIVVKQDWDHSIALYNHDGTIWIYRITEKEKANDTRT